MKTLEKIEDIFFTIIAFPIGIPAYIIARYIGTIINWIKRGYDNAL